MVVIRIHGQRGARAAGSLSSNGVHPAVSEGTARRSPGPSAASPRRPKPPRHRARSGSADAAETRHARSREGRRILHQRPRTRTADGHLRRVVEETQAAGRRQTAAEQHELRRPDRQDAAVVRLDAVRAAIRFDPTGQYTTARHQPRAAHLRACRWGITTCHITGKTRPRSNSSRRSNWRR